MMFESRTSAGATEKITWVGKFSREKQQRGPHDMEDTPRSVWNDVANWQTRKLSKYTKFQVSCLDDHHIQERGT